MRRLRYCIEVVYFNLNTRIMRTQLSSIIITTFLLTYTTTGLFSQEQSPLATEKNHETILEMKRHYLGGGLSLGAGDVTLDNTVIIPSFQYSYTISPTVSTDFSLKIISFETSPRMPDNFRYALSTSAFVGDIAIRFQVLRNVFIGGGVSVRSWSYMATTSKLQYPFEADIALFQKYDMGGHCTIEYHIPVHNNHLSLYGQAHYLPALLQSTSTVPDNIPFPFVPRFFGLGALFRFGF